MSFKFFESSSDKYSSQEEEKFSEEESKKYYSSEYEDKFKEYDQKDLFESLQEPVELKPLDLSDSNTKIEVKLSEADQDFVFIEDNGHGTPLHRRFKIHTNLDGTHFDDRIVINDSDQFLPDWTEGYDVQFEHVVFGHYGNDTIINNSSDHVYAFGEVGVDHYVANGDSLMTIDTMEEGETFTFSGEFDQVGEERSFVTFSNAAGKMQRFHLDWGLQFEATETVDGMIEVTAVAM